MKRKLLCVLLAAFMVFGLAACNGESGETPTGDPCEDCKKEPCECPPPNGGNGDNGHEDDCKCNDDCHCHKGDDCDCEDPGGNDERPRPWEYDESLVIYESIFDNPEEVCGADCGCENQNAPECGRLWRGRGGGERLMLTDEYAFEGDTSMLIYERGSGWSGATMNLMDMLEGDVIDINVYAWVKLTDDSVAARVLLSRKTVPAGGGAAGYGQLDDVHGEGGILSKYFLPVELYGNDKDTNEEQNPDEDAQSNIPNFMQFDDGWVLLRGQTTFIRALYDEFEFYIEANAAKGPSMECKILVGKIIITADVTM